MVKFRMNEDGDGDRRPRHDIFLYRKKRPAAGFLPAATGIVGRREKNGPGRYNHAPWANDI
jgi:hypothetical protein